MLYVAGVSVPTGCSFRTPLAGYRLYLTGRCDSTSRRAGGPCALNSSHIIHLLCPSIPEVTAFLLHQPVDFSALCTHVTIMWLLSISSTGGNRGFLARPWLIPKKELLKLTPTVSDQEVGRAINRIRNRTIKKVKKGSLFCDQRVNFSLASFHEWC